MSNNTGASNEDAKLGIIAALQSTNQGWYAIVENEDGTYTAGGNVSINTVIAAKADIAENEQRIRISDAEAFERFIDEQRVRMREVLGLTFIEAEFNHAANDMRKQHGFPEIGELSEERAPEHIVKLTLDLLGEDKRNEAGVDEFIASFDSFSATLAGSLLKENPEYFRKKNAQLKKQLMERINNL